MRTAGASAQKFYFAVMVVIWMLGDLLLSGFFLPSILWLLAEEVSFHEEDLRTEDRWCLSQILMLRPGSRIQVPSSRQRPRAEV